MHAGKTLETFRVLDVNRSKTLGEVTGIDAPFEISVDGNLPGSINVPPDVGGHFNTCPAILEGFGFVELRLDRHLSIAVDIPPPAIDLHRRKSLRKVLGILELRRDHDPSGSVHISVPCE